MWNAGNRGHAKTQLLKSILKRGAIEAKSLRAEHRYFPFRFRKGINMFDWKVVPSALTASGVRLFFFKSSDRWFPQAISLFDIETWRSLLLHWCHARYALNDFKQDTERFLLKKSYLKKIVLSRLMFGTVRRGEGAYTHSRLIFGLSSNSWHISNYQTRYVAPYTLAISIGLLIRGPHTNYTVRNHLIFIWKERLWNS